MRSNEYAYFLHPLGEHEPDFDSHAPPQELDTFGGVIEFHGEKGAGVSVDGGLAIYIGFLKLSGIGKNLAEECPPH
ncbi:MAG: hypothetical protein ACK6DX_14295 [Acidobacteriota bacterium]